MSTNSVREVSVMISGWNDVKYYVVQVPSTVSIESVRGALEGDFPIRKLKPNEWYPQMVYRCEHLHGWNVGCGTLNGGGGFDIIL